MVHTSALKTEWQLIQWRFEMRERHHFTGLGSLNDRHTELTQVGKDMKRYYRKRKQHEGMKWSVTCLEGQSFVA